MQCSCVSVCEQLCSVADEQVHTRNTNNPAMHLLVTDFVKSMRIGSMGAECTSSSQLQTRRMRKLLTSVTL